MGEAVRPARERRGTERAGSERRAAGAAAGSGNGPMKLADRKVHVVGLGRSGEAAARFLRERGARVWCSDSKTAGEVGPETVRRLTEAGCALRLGPQKPGDFLGADLVVVSPGVPTDLPPLQEALAAGTPVIGELELAARFLEAPVVAVTGSNGKTTTVSLIDHMLQAADIPHWTGGNIGRPLTGFLLADPAIPGPGVPRVVLAEVSSFQLETIERFRPWVSIWTNLSPDHLDRYPDMEAYAEAKARIFLNQTDRDTAVLPHEDAWLNAHPDRVRARVLPVARGGGVDPGPGAVLESRHVRLRLERDGPLERYDTERFPLVGRHNRENLAMALLAARLCGAAPDVLQRALESFRGLEHRLEWVGERGGVRFYNDSKATTVDSVVCALASFEGPVLLLAGGKDKGGSYAPLRGPLRQRARLLCLYGQAAGRMEKELAGSCPVLRVDDLEAAVRSAARSARSGDTVLLSPACSSFDMFRDYEDRGERFKQIVRRLLRENG